ncbi:RNA-directed DNA polymerase from mobile element jockey [Trichonephila clavipes]|uniref:RNA-directed DNA polymerase from mobile element jockey n=1 Tax=Trichonephila clavipes TaxID=2585209 RepID=A0A8X6RDN8_TRICX|nr:RNA-directed DNA polymerase from mobile element jockey [Trichonephila clavipes]
MEQVYPSIWKEAIVIPILQPGKDPKHPLSYRPIALTSCLVRLWNERSMPVSFISWRRTDVFLYFRVVFAKDDAPSTISSHWKAKLGTHSSGGTILSLFLTSRRHMIVLGAMEFLALYGYGLRSNLPCFIQNVLAARKFKVRLGDTLFPSFIQAEGVLQGSILSVTLFICHISPILSQFQPSMDKFYFVNKNIECSPPEFPVQC